MIGIRFSKANSTLLFLFGSFIVLAMCQPAFSVEEKPLFPPTSIGSLQCMPCHATEDENFVKCTRKSQPSRRIERREKGLAGNGREKCYTCHITKYETPRGFVGIETTPGSQYAVCEVKYGPGFVHAENKLTGFITRLLTLQLCCTCNRSQRIRAFRFPTLIHGGGH